MHLLVVEGTEAADGGDEGRVDGQLGGDVVIAGRVLTQVLLQLELPLQQLLALFLEHQLPVVLIFQQLLVQHTNEAILVICNILTDLFFCVSKLLYYGLNDFFIEGENFFDSWTACVVI